MADAKEPAPEVTLHGRVFTSDMAEISGFGGSYEEGCRLMVLAGVEFLANHAGEAPRVSHLQGVTGLDRNDNETAEKLERAMLDAPITADGEQTTCGKYGVTGAMVQYSKLHAIRANHAGWDAYCRESRERRAKEGA